MDGLSKETVFIDGTKLEACANKYTFLWKKSVGKWEEKMYTRIEKAVDLFNREYVQSLCVEKETCAADLEKIVSFLEALCRDHHVGFVYGRGHRKSIHQKYYELFRRFLDRQLLYDLHNSRFKGRNSYSKTDVDATFMHMKDDHMRNAQLKPGYNVQIGVDSEYIVGVDVFSDQNDVWTLVPFLKGLEEKTGFRYPSVTADSVYECEDCTGCCYKEKCTKAKENKKLNVSKEFIRKREISYRNILTEKGIRYRMNRSIQVEGAFGVLKQDYGFQRFLLRGKTKVKLELLLLCLGYNLNKLHAKIQNERTEDHFFEIKTA